MKSVISVLLVAMILGGCASSPPTRFYSLEPIAGEGEKALSGVEGPVGVARVELPPALDRRSLVRRKASNEFEVEGLARWAAPLDEMIRLVLAQNIQSRLSGRSVILPGEPKPKRDMKLVVVVFESFFPDQNQKVHLKADWSLVNEGTGQVVKRGEENLVVEAASEDANAIAHAMSAALAQLADRMVESI